MNAPENIPSVVAGDIGQRPVFTGRPIVDLAGERAFRTHALLLGVIGEDDGERLKRLKILRWIHRHRVVGIAMVGPRLIVRVQLAKTTP